MLHFDGAKEFGEFGCPVVDCASLKFDSVTTFEALALAVMWKVVAKFIAHDLADEMRTAERAGDGGDGSEAGDGAFFLVGFDGEFWDAGDAPINFVSGGFEFAVPEHSLYKRRVGK